MRPTVIVLCSAVLLVSGCAQQATRSPAPATTPTTRPVALDGCVQPSSAQLIDLGGGNQAAVLGTGRLGTWSRPPVGSVKGASPGRVGPNCEPHLTQPLRRGPGGRR
jgi:hypothetical protein